MEIALCAPQSNAALKRFFCKLQYVKSNLCTSLSLQSLNALQRIPVTGPSLQIFYEQHAKNDIHFWYNSKEQKIHQHKKRKTIAGQVAKPKRVRFDVSYIARSKQSRKFYKRYGHFFVYEQKLFEFIWIITHNS